MQTTVDFKTIRPYGSPASNDAGFEEFASIYVKRALDWPDGTVFRKFGNPDGGREGNGTLPNNEVWAWQVKYIFKFDSAEAGYVRSSFERTLNTEPALTKYIVLIPFDLPAGDTKGKKSSTTRWNNLTEQLAETAKSSGRRVEIILLTAHDMLEYLTQPENSGHLSYWFNIDLLSNSHQKRVLKSTLAKVGPRYSPEAHVELEVSQVFEAMGLSTSYFLRLREISGTLTAQTSRSWNNTSVFSDSDQRKYKSLLEGLRKIAREIANSARNRVATGQESGTYTNAKGLLDLARELHRSLRSTELQDGGYYVGDAATTYQRLHETESALNEFLYITTSASTQVAIKPELLVIGTAGSGKTHLFCDILRRRIDNGLPTILLLGQEFDGRNLDEQISSLCEFGKNIDDVLKVLQASAEATGERALLLIDAINESVDHSRWAPTIRAIQALLSEYPNVGLAVSCRSEFLSNELTSLFKTVIEHRGFEEDLSSAINRFSEAYKVDPNGFIPLSPEFTNPLYLHLLFKTLSNTSRSLKIEGVPGLLTLCESHFAHVNEVLSRHDRCDYDATENLVLSALLQISALDGETFDRSQVRTICENIHSVQVWSKSLLRGLIAEGILNEIGDGRLNFAYQRFADIVRAKALAELDFSEIVEFVEASGRNRDSRGVVSALNLVLPEARGEELFVVLSTQKGIPVNAISDFVSTLPLRSATSIREPAVQLIKRLLDSERFYEMTIDALLRISCSPGNPLNADFLSTFLSGLSLGERDSRWSISLFRKYAEGDTVASIINWHRPPSGKPAQVCSPEIARLASLVLCWFLTSNDREVRDRATKSLVNLAEANTESVLASFATLIESNDPYMIERICAAAYGLASRNADPSSRKAIAEAVIGERDANIRSHILIDDFIRSIQRFASVPITPFEVPSVNSVLELDETVMSIEEVQAVVESKDGYATIWYSLSGYGDFNTYVIQPALRHFTADEPEHLLDYVQRSIFTRVLDLGWTPNLFLAFDRSVVRGREDGSLERIGKKYQWIGFYEVLAELTRGLQFRESAFSEEVEVLEHIEQLIWRDIDPSVLYTNSVEQPMPNWNVQGSWGDENEELFAMPKDLAGFPSVRSLLELVDPDGTEWLCLTGSPSHRTKPNPEDTSLELPTRNKWAVINSYVMREEDRASLTQWVNSRDWFGRWMPEPGDTANVLLGDFPYYGPWKNRTDDRYSFDDYKGFNRFSWHSTTVGYHGTGTERDKSEETSGGRHLPSLLLSELLDVHHERDFRWTDSRGLAITDAASHFGGDSSLIMRKDLIDSIHSSGHFVFWTVLLGHELFSDAFHRNNEADYRWVSASASYFSEGDHTSFVSAIANQYRSGGRITANVEWTL